MMNADGSNQTFLTEGEKPKWSPDNRFIAFTSTRDNRGEVIPLFPDSAVPADALYLITPDGSKIIKLTDHDNESITDYFWLP
jgi:Tol biopolymer transport system component